MTNCRDGWTTNNDGVPVPRRTFGSVAQGYSDKDFTLVCKLCGDDYGNDQDLPMGVVHAHFLKHHPETEGKITLELLWLGQGPAPKGKTA